MANYKCDVVRVKIDKVAANEFYKSRIKKILGKKYNSCIDMEELNNIILEDLMKNYRNYPYNYSFSSQANKIELTINFSK